MGERIGVFVCGCGPEISEKLDIQRLAKEARGLEGVVVSYTFDLLCSPDGKEFMREVIKEKDLTRLVIAGCSPKEHEHTFRKVLQEAGINPFLLQVVNIREQCAWVVDDYAKATEKASRLLRAGIQRVKLHEELKCETIQANTDVLVVGAGVAGMSAALALASAKRQVFLIEQSPAIGGKVALYDEIFPDMECGSCILDPLMDSVLHNEDIKLFTYSVLKEVAGYLGNFHVTIYERPRFVDSNACIGCEACFKACPVLVPNEYNQYLNSRGAIYIPYAGALPHIALIDDQNCLHYQGQLCDCCSEACPFDAIRFDDRGRQISFKVGAIVLATGFDLPETFSLHGHTREKIPHLLTGLQFERIINPAGPTQGNLITHSGDLPQKVVIVHCASVEQGDLKPLRSQVCTMAALKYTRIIIQRWPSVSVTNIFSDLCLEQKYEKAFLDGLEEIHHGSFIRVHPSKEIKIREGPGGLELSFFDPGGKQCSIYADMLIINPLPGSNKNTKSMAALLDIELDEEGFFREPDPVASPLSSSTPGIWIAGSARGLKDIHTCITEGRAVAGEILSTLIPGKAIDIEPTAARLHEELCSGCGLCITTCHYRAISRSEGDQKVNLNRLLCMGCGTCAATCPSGAIDSPLFTDRQIWVEIQGLLESSAKRRV